MKNAKLMEAAAGLVLGGAAASFGSNFIPDSLPVIGDKPYIKKALPAVAGLAIAYFSKGDKMDLFKWAALGMVAGSGTLIANRFQGIGAMSDGDFEDVNFEEINGPMHGPLNGPGYDTGIDDEDF